MTSLFCKRRWPCQKHKCRTCCCFDTSFEKQRAATVALNALVSQALPFVQEVLDLSKEQVQDLMFLRWVYFLRRHELEAKRTPDLKNAQQHDGEAMYGVIRMIGAAMRLQDNTVEDIRFRIRFGWAMYLGVRPSLQCLYVQQSWEQKRLKIMSLIHSLILNMC